MSKGRLEAFSDGVLAIIITIVILMFDIPEGNDLNAFKEMAPLFIVYLVSFVMIGMNWANHHHMLQVTEKVSGKIIWANQLPRLRESEKCSKRQQKRSTHHRTGACSSGVCLLQTRAVGSLCSACSHGSYVGDTRYSHEQSV